MIKAILLNDTTRNIGHFGCSSVIDNIEFLCNKNNISIIKKFKKTNLKKDKSYIKYLKSSQIVIINGEGTMHHDQKEACDIFESALIAKSQGKKIFLINSIWQDNFSLSKYLWIFEKIFVRDGLSKIQIENDGYKCVVVPDLSLYKGKEYFPKEFNTNKKPIVIDSVYWNVTKILADYAFVNNYFFHIMDAKLFFKLKIIKLISILKNKIFLLRLARKSDIKKSSLVITGRYHALCIAIKYKIPFLCISSNSHKIEGIFYDLQIPIEEFVIKSQNLTLQDINILSRKIIKNNDNYQIVFEEYLQLAQIKINEMFLQIKNIS